MFEQGSNTQHATLFNAASEAAIPVQLQIKKDYSSASSHFFSSSEINNVAIEDAVEHEARSTADKVMRMPEQNFIRRKCAHCEEEEKVQRKPLVSFIQKKESSNNNVVASDNVSSQINSTKGSGNP
jgi:hypothetical protein